MAQAAVGVDMLEIRRMERALARHPKLAERVFSDEERAYCFSMARPAEHFAARWAAREATLKALGCGFSAGIRFSDVTVSRRADGRPEIVLAGKALELARAQHIDEVAISLSHTKDIAVANAVAITDEVRPVPEEKSDPKAELAQSFRAAKSILDELDRLQDNILDAIEQAPSPDAPDDDPSQSQLPL